MGPLWLTGHTVQKNVISDPAVASALIAPAVDPVLQAIPAVVTSYRGYFSI